MTLVQHGVMSMIIQSKITPKSPILIATAGLLGAGNDLVRLLQKDKSKWDDLYRKSHALTLINLIIPHWNTHVVTDYFLHEEDGGWKWYTKYIELGLWLSEIYLYREIIYSLIHKII